MANLYYEAPPNAEFEELKAAAIELWKKVDTDGDRFGYASSKINEIKDLKNFKDNFMVMVAMFDSENQEKLSGMLGPSARKAVRDRMIDGGSEPWTIAF